LLHDHEADLSEYDENNQIAYLQGVIQIAEDALDTQTKINSDLEAKNKILRDDSEVKIKIVK
jgi:hypothetical protein